MKRPLFVCLLVLLFASATEAAPPAQVEFNRDIRPILADKCFACHGPNAKNDETDLRLDTFEGATADHAIVPGKPEESAAWARIVSEDESERMPPPDSNKTLSAEEKALLRRWIEQGAVYQKHWAFERPQKAPLPPQAGAAPNAIDALVGARLVEAGLKPQGEAPREVLIRRVAFTLTGLPPTPAEVDAFLQDASPQAYENMVDRYLASPRYGEEMARHWLDAARYADTHGLHLDNERFMWAFRDYVVSAFNSNMPYDQFTVEQIAGDQLPNATPEQLTATGFNRCNVTTSEGGAIDAEMRFRYAVDRTSTTMQTWMGLTGGCAVCHDHKFDPLTQKEFYQLYAFFNSAADPGLDGNGVLTQPAAKYQTPEDDRRIADFDRRIADAQKAFAAQIAALPYQDPADLTEASQSIETVWLEDAFPAGAQVATHPARPPQFMTAADGGQVFSGAQALKISHSTLTQNFCGGTAPLLLPVNGVIFAYVWIDPQDAPASVMLQFYKGGWLHRAVWGDYDAIPWGAVNTPQRVAMGALPEAGKWVRLEAPIEKLGLKPGDVLTGFALTQSNGTVYWDHVGVFGLSAEGADPQRSFRTWWRQGVGKGLPGVPADLQPLAKAGPDAQHKSEDVQRLRAHYLQHVCATTKTELAAVQGGINKLIQERAALLNAIPYTFIYRDLPTPRNSFVMLRGEYDKPGEKVEPATPAVLPPLAKADPNGRATRLDLARWLVSAEHPLTARVAVNRFWQQVFGVGLVSTSGDFGAQGEPPSHPELLDWLAVDFRESGWNVKRLMRQMLLSAPFRRAPQVTPEMLARDPANRLLARGPRLRLDAEQLRDNALFVSGLMDQTMGGRGVKPYQPPNIWEPVGFSSSNTRNYRQDAGPALYRRSLYVFFKRTAPPPFMVNFDAPNREQFCTRRERSNTPLQALQLMNDVQHFEAARALAARMLKEGGAEPRERIAWAYRTLLARSPREAELKVVAAQLEKHLAHYANNEAAAKQALAHGAAPAPADLPPAELAAYTLVANMLLNLDETLNRN